MKKTFMSYPGNNIPTPEVAHLRGVIADMQKKRLAKEKEPNEKEPNEKEPRIFFIRHSLSRYQNFMKKLEGDNPDGDIEIEEQVPDLSREGIELAKSEAIKFFSNFNPEKDTLVFVSSNQRRAMDTASIYIEVAKEKGFEVLKHKKPGTRIAKRIGGEYLRTLNSLSLNGTNYILTVAFSPLNNSALPKINWDKVSEDTKAKFNLIREFIQKNGDKMDWNKNYFHYADMVKKYVPEIKSIQDLFNTQYQLLLEQAEIVKSNLANNKNTAEKRVNIIAFGHENYVNIALERDTGKSTIGNLEAVQLDNGVLKRL